MGWRDTIQLGGAVPAKSWRDTISSGEPTAAAAAPGGNDQVGAGEAALRGAAQAASGGWIDEATAALGGAYDAATGPLDFDTAYSGWKQAIGDRDKQATRDQPLANGLGAAGGALLSAAAVPALGAAGSTAKGAAAVGAVTGAGMSDANLLNPTTSAVDEAGRLVRDTAAGAVTGAAMQGAFNKLAPTASSAATELGSAAKSAAGMLKPRAASAAAEAPQEAVQLFDSFGNLIKPPPAPAPAPAPRLPAMLDNLIDYGVGAAAGMASHNPIVGAGSTVASKVVRDAVKKNARPMAAAGLDRIGDMLKASPEAFGRYAPVLQDAARRGSHALAVTHFLLMQQDPNYAGQFENE